MIPCVSSISLLSLSIPEQLHRISVQIRIQIPGKKLPFFSENRFLVPRLVAHRNFVSGFSGLCEQSSIFSEFRVVSLEVRPRFQFLLFSVIRPDFLQQEFSAHRNSKKSGLKFSIDRSLQIPIDSAHYFQGPFK